MRKVMRQASRCMMNDDMMIFIIVVYQYFVKTVADHHGHALP